MNADDRKELLRLVELEYERTTKFIEGWTSITTSLRGWAITVWAGLLGFAFSSGIAGLAALAFFAVAVFAVLDAYYSALYEQTVRRARELERITNQHFDALARGNDNPRLLNAADTALAAHNYGLYTNMRAIRLRDAVSGRQQRFVGIYVSLALMTIFAWAALMIATPISGTAASPHPSATASAPSPSR